MTSTPDELASPQDSDSESSRSLHIRRQRASKSPLGRLPYRRSNASLSNLFQSTTSLPTHGQRTGSESETITSPAASTPNGTVFSPTGSTIRSPSPSLSTRLGGGEGSEGSESRDVIIRAFSPYISVLASEDTEELVRHKGIHGGLLELLRPFGEHVPGKVTIRDSNGASRSWEDYAVRFVGVKDGQESPRAANRNSADSTGARNGQRASMLEYKPARLRTGGDVPQIEDVVERHLTFAEEQSGPISPSYFADHGQRDTHSSPFYLLYLRRLLSGLPLTPAETLSHPVASIIAISSRSQSPIEDLRTLYTSSNTGPHRLPQWVHNEFLRYYILIHDEDYDDIQKSMSLYDQMKRHFGLHCHLLRLRSSQAVESDDGAVRLPVCEWIAAAEELAEISRREMSEDEDEEDHFTPWIFESDCANIRAFVREMVTQSVVPSMERASATWNEQVASRRRGISGRFMSLSKRFTAFGGGGGNRNSSVPSLTGGIGGGGSNYDSLQGFYRPDASEAVMRRLADYCMMLRDYKLAQSTYEILVQDFKTDKAWRHYAAANEMAAVSSLIALSGVNTKVRVEAIDGYLESAYYSYITRATSPYNALRALALGMELLKLRGGGAALDAAARWGSRILDDRLVGPVGHVLLMERIALCFSNQVSSAPPVSERRRKAGFWNLLACDAWLKMDKTSRAEGCLNNAVHFYRPAEGGVKFDHMQDYLLELQEETKRNRSGPRHLDEADMLAAQEADETVEPLQVQVSNEDRPAGIGARRPSLAGLSGHTRGKSLSNAAMLPAPPQLQTVFDPLGAVPSAYDTMPSSAVARRSSVSAGVGLGIVSGAGGVVPLSPHAEGFASAGVPLSASKEGAADDGFE